LKLFFWFFFLPCCRLNS